MKTQKCIYLLLVCFALFSFSKAVNFSALYPKYFPKPAYDFAKNPLSQSKILLGRVLFYDPILSRDNAISCASCHSPYTAFTHVDHALSHGIEDKIGIRNSPALMNLAWHKLFMHDGAVNHLDVQALAPITNPVEMDSKLDSVLIKLQKSKIYPQLFYTAFGDSNINTKHTLQAISQFLLTLISSNSKYDSVIRKQASFTLQEQKGYNLFKKNCSTCHTEPLFTNNEFKNNGLPVDTSLNDFGRIRVTRNPKDSLLFKVPTLRNIEFSGPYMHDGRYKRLAEVFNHYNKGIVISPTLDKTFEQRMELSSNDKVDLTAFLLTLTDKTFLFNPKFGFPREILLK